MLTPTFWVQILLLHQLPRYWRYRHLSPDPAKSVSFWQNSATCTGKHAKRSVTAACWQNSQHIWMECSLQSSPIQTRAVTYPVLLLTQWLLKFLVRMAGAKERAGFIPAPV